MASLTPASMMNGSHVVTNLGDPCTDPLSTNASIFDRDIGIERFIEGMSRLGGVVVFVIALGTITYYFL